MNTSRKKFWSLIFGAILANSYVWLVSLSSQVPVPEMLQEHTVFVIDFYSPIITALLSISLTIVLSLVMLKVFNICVSEHILWLFWPSLGFVVFTFFTANALIVPILQAVVPALVMLALIYWFKRRQQSVLIHG